MASDGADLAVIFLDHMDVASCVAVAALHARMHAVVQRRWLVSFSLLWYIAGGAGCAWAVLIEVALCIFQAVLHYLTSPFLYLNPRIIAGEELIENKTKLTKKTPS